MKVLIVDDDPASRFVLEDSVKEWNYEVQAVPDGERALEAVQSDPPDMILLDIMMPGMDGYEVCRRLKKNPDTCEIPVLFLTTKEEVGDKTKGFELGAVDYITKPFEPLEVKARVETHLALKQARQSLKNQNVILEEKVRQRTKELSDAQERLEVLDKAKSDFLNLIAHELRTPLTSIFGISEILFYDDLDGATRASLKKSFSNARNRMLSILEEALLITQIEVSGKTFLMETITIREVLVAAVKFSTKLAESRKIVIGPVQDCLEKTTGDFELLSTALAALIKTAVKFSQKEKMVSLSCASTENEVSIGIRAEGLTVPENELPKFFEVFSIADPITPGGDLGLGPPVADAIIKLFHGSVAVENHDAPGILFTVKLKRLLNDAEKDE